MKKKFASLLILLSALISFTGCSVIEGRPEKDNLNQAEGSNVWWNARQDYEDNASQLNDEFGDQPGDANFERQNAVDTDAQTF